MGQRGPLPLPASELKKRGSSEIYRQGRAARPDIPASRPAPPDRIQGDALQEWNRICDAAAELGILHALDRPLLTIYCDLWTRYEQVVPELAASPEKQYLREELLKLGRRLTDTLTVLGLTPATRTRLARTEDQPDRRATGVTTRNRSLDGSGSPAPSTPGMRIAGGKVVK